MSVKLPVLLAPEKGCDVWVLKVKLAVTTAGLQTVTLMARAG